MRSDRAGHLLGPPRHSDRVPPPLRQIHEQPLREVTGAVDVSGGAENTGHGVTVARHYAVG